MSIEPMVIKTKVVKQLLQKALSEKTKGWHKEVLNALCLVKQLEEDLEDFHNEQE